VQIAVLKRPKRSGAAGANISMISLSDRVLLKNRSAAGNSDWSLRTNCSDCDQPATLVIVSHETLQSGGAKRLHLSFGFESGGVDCSP